MVTRNPRVNVCVTPAQHELLRKLSDFQGRSAASLVKAMVDAAEPLMVKTVRMLELADQAKGQSQKAARDALQAVLEELQALSGDTDQLDLLNLLSGPSDDAGASHPARSEATEESAAPPPSSNTGVRVEQDRNRGKARNG